MKILPGVTTEAYAPTHAQCPSPLISTRLCVAAARKMARSSGRSPCASVVITQRIVGIITFTLASEPTCNRAPTHLARSRAIHALGGRGAPPPPLPRVLGAGHFAV